MLLLSRRDDVLANLWQEWQCLARRQHADAPTPGAHCAPAPWFERCLLGQSRQRAQYMDVLGQTDARVVLSARCGRLCALAQHPWRHPSGEMHLR